MEELKILLEMQELRLAEFKKDLPELESPFLISRCKAKIQECETHIGLTKIAMGTEVQNEA